MKFSKNLNKVLMGVLMMSVVAQARDTDGKTSTTYRPGFNSLGSGSGLLSVGGGLNALEFAGKMNASQEFGPRTAGGSSAVLGVWGLFVGFGTILQSFSLEAEGAELPTAADIAHKLRNDPSYAKLVQSHGRARAEEFLSDMISGWTAERLIEKYARGAEEKKALMALLDKAQAPKKAAATNTQKEAQGQVAGH